MREFINSVGLIGVGSTLLYMGIATKRSEYKMAAYTGRIAGLSISAGLSILLYGLYDLWVLITSP